MRRDATVTVDGERLTIDDVVRVARAGVEVAISDVAGARIAASRAALETLIARGDTIYGVTTGFGDLCDVNVSPDQIVRLQENLVLTAALGAGPALASDDVRAAMLARLNCFCRGHSAVRPIVADGLRELLNRGVTPLVPSKGSLGTGELVPAAYLALVLMGRGEAVLNQERLPGSVALARAGLEPLVLQAKEALAIMDGCSFLSGLGAMLAHDAGVLYDSADAIGALALAAVGASTSPLDARAHAARAHAGPVHSAAAVRAMLGLPPTPPREGRRVQDAISLRCIPQVHGAYRDALRYVTGTVQTELNASSDNPLVFAEDAVVLAGGNFHGQAVAGALDLLAINLAGLAAMSERRIAQLLSAHRSGLSAFLAPNPGLNAGYMVVQYTAAALVNECKTLAHPASVDTVTVCADQEDHASMGMGAALKARTVLENARQVLAAELLCAAQAADLSGRTLAPGARVLHEEVRARVPRLDDDRLLDGEFAAACALVREGIPARILRSALAPAPG